VAIYTASIRGTAGTVARPMMSIFGIASRGGWLREAHCFNTTTTAVSIMLCRFTAVGTPGAGITVAPWDSDVQPAELTPFTTHSADATLGVVFNRAPLGAAIGAGVIWTFWSGHGLKILPGTANGIGLILATGTGQVCDTTMVWEE
jgi:hypothetical protein